MIKKLTKFQFDILIILGLIGLYLATRLMNLDIVPMFTDEAIYMRWSQVGLRDAAWRFIPLTDGKPPLYHWLVMGVMATGVFSDPLIEGRIISVFAGLASAILIGILSYVLFKKRRVAYLTSLFYILSPMMLVYDRLAIVDSLLTTISIASALLAIVLVKYLRFDTALLLGLTIGSGLLTKSSGLFFLLLTPATVLVGDWKRKHLSQKLMKWLFFLVMAAVLAQAVYGILRLSQFFYRIEQKNFEFIVPVSEFLQNPFQMTWGNMKSLFKWQVGYLTLPWVGLIALSFGQLKRWKEHLLMVAYVVPVFIVIASFNKIIFPRFLLFSTPFLLVLAASGFDFLCSKTKNLKIAAVGLLLLFLPAIKTDISWIVKPGSAAIPQADKDQYFEGQPSGHGVEEIVKIIEGYALEENVFLGTDGTFGLTPDAFLVYLLDNPNVQIEGYYPVSTIPDEVASQSAKMRTFFVYYNVQEVLDQEEIELVGEYEKVSPSNTTYLRLYEVHPKSE
jgi:4-amino-4-deoxy-L-arabinose transferase-like glycosyltransferase